MALNKAQLMEVPGGPGITGAVKPGTGISISGDGTISVNPATSVTQIVAGTNITLTPANGLGVVTVTASGPDGSVTSVGVNGGTTGLTFTGSPVTSSGVMSMGGVLNVANGGTGATSQAAAAAAVLPVQGGQAGKFLTTDGTTTTWATVIAAPEIPAGTVMSFFQAAAPTGWAQVTTQDNKTIRIVGGAGGGVGGTIPFTTLFSSASSYSGSINITSGQVGDAVLSAAQLASHQHNTNGQSGQQGVSHPTGNGSQFNGPLVSPTGGNAAHTHSLAGAAAVGNFTSDFGVKYIDMILAAKS